MLGAMAQEGLTDREPPLETWWSGLLWFMAAPAAMLTAAAVTGHGDIQINVVVVVIAIVWFGLRALDRRANPEAVERGPARGRRSGRWWRLVVGAAAAGSVVIAEAPGRKLVAFGVDAVVLAGFGLLDEPIAAYGRRRRRAANPNPFALP
jgi:hypothetical protein